MGAFDFIGDFFDKDARNRASKAQHDAIDVYKGIDPNLQGQTAADAYQSMDQSGTDAQKQAMDELQQQYKQGGMDTGSKAALQEAELSAGQQARGATDAALARAQSEGRLNSGRALSAQLQAGQQATNADAMAGAQAAADASGRAQSALTNSAQVGSTLAGQAQQTAQGQNQAAEYNAANEQQAQGQTIQNKLAIAQGASAGDQAIAGTDTNRAAQARESAGAIGDSAMKAAMMGMADGGVVPGKPKKDGDSPENDTVKAKLSPGELVVPRSIVKKGKTAVEEFVAQLLGGQ